MRRRDFIALIGCTATWPLIGRAQQPALPVIGFLHARSANDTVEQLMAFRRGLMEAGFVEGQSVTIEYRFASGQYDRLSAMAAELARRPVNVIFAGADPAARAAKAATATVPIVFTVAADPIKMGLVSSYNRPGSNATGMNILSATLEAKRLGLLRELVPGATVIGVIVNPNFAQVEIQLRDMQEAARAVGLQILFLRVQNDADIEAAFAIVAQQRMGALAVAADPFLDTRKDRIVVLAARHAVPTIYHFREHAAAGGLMSYGIDLMEVYRQLGVYTGRILKGTNPADLPVMQPTKFQFVINQKTATTLGVKFSDNLLSLADEVIE